MSKSKFNEHDIILLILYVDNCNSIIGKTKFQKVIFLYEEECHKEIEFHKSFPKDGSLFGFQPHYFGPFSEKLPDYIKELVSFGFISEIELEDNSYNMVKDQHEKKIEYKLTDIGMNYISQELLKHTDSIKMDQLKEFKVKYNQMDDNSILRYVYTTYEKMTENSLIKDRYID